MKRGEKDSDHSLEDAGGNQKRDLLVETQGGEEGASETMNVRGEGDASSVEKCAQQKKIQRKRYIGGCFKADRGGACKRGTTICHWESSLKTVKAKKGDISRQAPKIHSGKLETIILSRTPGQLWGGPVERLF